MHWETQRLRRRHAHLDQMIAVERRSPAPDHLKLQELKRRKLRVKEKLAAIETRNLIFA